MLAESSDTLFICIVRDPVSWIQSFYRNPHHVSHLSSSDDDDKTNISKFLNDEFWSTDEYDKEIMIDRNIYTNDRYKNIFEMRHIKLKYMIEDLPKLVDNYVFVKYEDILNNFYTTMNKIRDAGRLNIKCQKTFPLNTTNYKGINTVKYVKYEYSNIHKNIILEHPNLNLYYEKQLEYI